MTASPHKESHVNGIGVNFGGGWRSLPWEAFLTSSGLIPIVSSTERLSTVASICARQRLPGCRWLLRGAGAVNPLLNRKAGVAPAMKRRARPELGRKNIEAAANGIRLSGLERIPNSVVGLSHLERSADKRAIVEQAWCNG